MSKPALLVLDDYEGKIAGAPALERLRALADVTVMNRPLAEADFEALAQTRILLALRERTRFDEAFFARLPKLELVLQTGGHAYHLDRVAATARGITVALGRRVRMPTVAVPELTFGLMLALLRSIHPLAGQMAQGEWPLAVGGTLAGRTLGILGLGRLGKPVARLAQAFGMRVIAWGRDGASADSADGIERLNLDALLATADIVSIHLRLSPESRGLLNREKLALMRPDALLINTSRGAIIDEDALVEALATGKLGGAGLDVFAVEPLPAESPLRSLPNVVLTPHIGWKAEEVFREFAEIAADQLEAWLAGQLPVSEVLNPDAIAQPCERMGGLAQV